MPPASVRTSDILEAWPRGPSDRLSVRRSYALGERAYALLIVVLGLPNCLPMPPPIPLICGILLMFVAAQIIVGWPSPWLPKRLLDRSIARDDLVKACVPRRALAELAGEGRQAAARRVFDQVLALRLMGVVLFAVLAGAGLRRTGHRPDPARPRRVPRRARPRGARRLCRGRRDRGRVVGTSLSLGFVFAVIASADRDLLALAGVSALESRSTNGSAPGTGPALRARCDSISSWLRPGRACRTDSPGTDGSRPPAGSAAARSSPRLPP